MIWKGVCMKQVGSCIKRFLGWTLVYVCIFQTLQLSFSKCSTYDEVIEKNALNEKVISQKVIDEKALNDKPLLQKQEDVKKKDGDVFMKELEILQKDTEYIIKANPSKCLLIRDEAIKNDEGEIIAYNKKERDNVIVRFSLISSENKELDFEHDVSNKVYSLTAMFNEDIKKDDVLKNHDGTLFKVLEIEDFYYCENNERCVYKKSGKALAFLT